MLAEAGYAQYEVSGLRADRTAQCAHNLNYWRFGDYLGIGAGAHGKLTLGSEQTRCCGAGSTSTRRDYLAQAGTPAAIGGDERIEPARRPFEYMLNALRLVDGFTLAEFEARTGLARCCDRRRNCRQASTRGWLDVRRRAASARPTWADASPTTWSRFSWASSRHAHGKQRSAASCNGRGSPPRSQC